MIELKISKKYREGGASAFEIKPQHISLGSMGANRVDTMHIDVPEEWHGKTVRLTFVPDDTTKENKAIVLDETMQCEVTSGLSGACESGRIFADAVDAAGYTAYSASCGYTAEAHPAAGGEAPAYTPDEYQQFVGQIETYSRQAVEAKQRASEIAAAVQQMAGDVGCVSFQVNENGELVETLTLTLDGAPKTEQVILGPVSDYALAVRNGYTGSAADWLLTLKGEKGDTGPVGPEGAAGPTGIAGPMGAAGKDASVTIGTVKTAAPGQPAAVENRGEAGAAVLDFEIPQGMPGKSISACRFDADGHLILTIHDYTQDADTELDAGSAATETLLAQMQDKVDAAAGYVRECQEISQLAKGYFPTEIALRAAYPDETGETGWWAIVGNTDTIWVWDDETAAWKDSGVQIDLSNYYTKSETDAQIDAEKNRAAAKENELSQQLDQQSQTTGVTGLTISNLSNITAATAEAKRAGNTLSFQISATMAAISSGGTFSGTISYPAGCVPVMRATSTVWTGNTIIMAVAAGNTLLGKVIGGTVSQGMSFVFPFTVICG